MSVTVERALTRDQVEKVRLALATKGITMVGDSGTFSQSTPIGYVGGSFAYKEGTLQVNVTKHPPFMGRTVEGRIKSGIEEAIS